MENQVPSSSTAVISRSGYDDEEHGEIDDVVNDAMPFDNNDGGDDVQHARYCIEDRRCTEQSTRDAANVVVPFRQQRHAAGNQNDINDLATDGGAVAVAEDHTLTNSANGRRAVTAVFTLSEQQLQELIQCGEAYVTPTVWNSASV